MNSLRASIANYTEYARSEQGRPHLSVNTYRNTLLCFVDWTAKETGHEPTPEEVTPSLVRRYDAHLKTKKTRQGRTGLGQASRLNALTCIRSFFAFLIERGITGANPTDGIKIRVTERPRQVCASEEEVCALFTAARSFRKPQRERLAAAVLSVMAYAGLRNSEVCDLCVEDCLLHQERPVLVVKKGKGNKRREVPLHRNAVEYLRQWLEVRPVSDLPFVFTVPVISHTDGLRVIRLTGGRLNGILRALTEASRYSVKRHLTAHSFRRFAATRLLEVPGSSLAYARDLLGHESIMTTIKYVGSHTSKLHALVNLMQVGDSSSEAPQETPRATDRAPARTLDRLSGSRTERRPAWRRAG